MKPVRVGEDIVIDADTLKIGKTLAFCSVDIKHKNTGALIAQGKHTKYVGWKTKRRLSWDDGQMLTKWCEYLSFSRYIHFKCIEMNMYTHVYCMFKINEDKTLLLMSNYCVLWESGWDKVCSTHCLLFKALIWLFFTRGSKTEASWHNRGGTVKSLPA